MTNPADNIVRQAKRGSVAAIIQVLNEKLADSGVRTRAIFADGVLQLLCEAATPEQLDIAVLPERIKQILEAIAPRNIRRVNINSRIVREQQLLWLEEINRDPEHQLLWSKEITLKKPNLVKQVMEEWQTSRSVRAWEDPAKTAAAKPLTRKRREQMQLWKTTGGLVILALLLAGGWALYRQFGVTNLAGGEQQASQPVTATSPSGTVSATTAPSSVPPSTDPFVQAVRIAEQASQSGLQARSRAQWLDLAAQWQKASDLMAQVEPTDGRYVTAQDRVSVYRQNSETALQAAENQPSE